MSWNAISTQWTSQSIFSLFQICVVTPEKDGAVEGLQKQIDDIVKELNLLKEQQALQTGRNLVYSHFWARKGRECGKHADMCVGYADLLSSLLKIWHISLFVRNKLSYNFLFLNILSLTYTTHKVVSYCSAKSVVCGFNKCQSLT